MLFHKTVEYGECHVRVYGRRAISEQQRGVHHLTYLARFYYEGCLHTFLHRDEVVVYGADSEQRRYGGMCRVDVTVREDDVVNTIVHTLLSFLAELVNGSPESALALAYIEQHGQFLGLETLVAYVAEYVELGVCQHRLWQTHHLAV